MGGVLGIGLEIFIMFYCKNVCVYIVGRLEKNVCDVI